MDSGSKDFERRILLHNSDDVKQLLRLMELLKNVDIHRAFYKSGFPINGGKIKGINLKKSDLIINGISYSPSDYIAFPSVEFPYHLQMKGSDGSFELILQCESKGNNVYVERINGLDSDKMAILETFPSFVNNYIILKENGSLHYPTINILASALSETALARI